MEKKKLISLGLVVVVLSSGCLAVFDNSADRNDFEGEITQTTITGTECWNETGVGQNDTVETRSGAIYITLNRSIKTESKSAELNYELQKSSDKEGTWKLQVTSNEAENGSVENASTGCSARISYSVEVKLPERGDFEVEVIHNGDSTGKVTENSGEVTAGEHMNETEDE